MNVSGLEHNTRTVKGLSAVSMDVRKTVCCLFRGTLRRMSTSKTAVLCMVLTTSVIIVSQMIFVGPYSLHTLMPHRQDVLETTAQSLRSAGLFTFAPNTTTMASTDLEPDHKCLKKAAPTNIVFIKVHKSGSTTVANILARYALIHNLNVALPNKSPNTARFNHFNHGLPTSGVSPIGKGQEYNVLFNHMTYNRTALELFMPNNTFYCAIMRKPGARFLSAVNYYYSLPPKPIQQYMLGVAGQLEKSAVNASASEKNEVGNVSVSGTRPWTINTSKTEDRVRPQKEVRSIAGNVHDPQMSIAGTVNDPQKGVAGIVNDSRRSVPGTVNDPQRSVAGTVNDPQRSFPGGGNAHTRVARAVNASKASVAEAANTSLAGAVAGLNAQTLTAGETKTAVSVAGDVNDPQKKASGVVKGSPKESANQVGNNPQIDNVADVANAMIKQFQNSSLASVALPSVRVNASNSSVNGAKGEEQTAPDKHNQTASMKTVNGVDVMAPVCTTLMCVLSLKSMYRKVMEIPELYNSIAYDSGLPLAKHLDEDAVRQHIAKLDRELDLMLVMEHFNESLILLKRRARLSLQDILHFQLNSGKKTPPFAITEIDAEFVRQWQMADEKIYKYFYDKFLTEVRKEGDNFVSEVNHFKSVMASLHTFCASELKDIDVLVIQSSSWNAEFTLNAMDCKFLQVTELNFQKILLRRASRRFYESMNMNNTV